MRQEETALKTLVDLVKTMSSLLAEVQVLKRHLLQWELAIQNSPICEKCRQKIIDEAKGES